MNKLLKFLTKYWIVISICATLLTSLFTMGWHFYSRLDADEDKINATNAWVADHDDTLQQLRDDVTKLKEDQRLRENGQCK